MLLNQQTAFHLNRFVRAKQWHAKPSAWQVRGAAARKHATGSVGSTATGAAGDHFNRKTRDKSKIIKLLVLFTEHTEAR